MTRARALKDIIRARAAKTGERYTTARRHVLNSRQSPAVAPEARRAAALRPNPTGAPPATAPAAKGGVSDAKSREKTGYPLDHWFGVLDRFGGPEKGHTALARHLATEHKVDGWYAQGITVAYERARGVRAPNQRRDGDYEVSVSKVLTATVADVLAALTEPSLRKRWSKTADESVLKRLFSSLDTPSSRGVVVRPDGQGRYRYKWGDTTVQFYLLPRPGGKLSLVVSNSGLPTAAMVDERRAQWRTTLDALARLYAPSTRRR